jgi:hypothetical protein
MSAPIECLLRPACHYSMVCDSRDFISVILDDKVHDHGLRMILRILAKGELDFATSLFCRRL